MPNLTALLRHTLLGTARPDLVSGDGGGLPAAEGRSPHWSWNWSALNVVSDLACDVSEAGCGRLRVCERLEWHALTVRYKKRSFALELEPAYLLKQFSTSYGEIPTLTHGWLPATLEFATLLVFGYELDQAGKLIPMHRRALESDKLMPDSVAAQQPAQAVQVPGNQRLTLRASPLRVLVFVELALCAPGADFDPQGVATVSRIRPHVTLIANQDLEGFDAGLTVMRPQTTDMQLAPQAGQRSDQVDGIGRHHTTSLFTDTNYSFAPAAPFWSVLFDYYKVDVTSGNYVMTAPSFAARSIEGAVSVDGLLGRSPRIVTKVPRQGQFDNLHIAPPMSAPLAVRQQPQHQGWLLERITMAPVCIHDCLHVHWRWGAGYYGLAQQGWSSDGPHTRVGAPMIPLNQTLKLDLNEGRGFRYRVAVNETVPRGTLQHVMHHGMAYALLVDSKLLSVGRSAMTYLFMPPTGVPASWALFYFCMRFVPTRLGQPQEALQIEDLTAAMS